MIFPMTKLQRLARQAGNSGQRLQSKIYNLADYDTFCAVSNCRGGGAVEEGTDIDFAMGCIYPNLDEYLFDHLVEVLRE